MPATETIKLEEVQIELSGICNAKCSYCRWWERSIGQQIMDLDLALRLLKECADLEVDMVRYHHLGEPFVHPNLFTILEAGDSLDLKNQSLSTNCLLLKGHRAENIRKFSKLDLIFSVHYVMGEDFYNRCTRNIEKFLEHPITNKSVVVQMICHVDARPDFENFMGTFLPMVEGRDKVHIQLKQPRTFPEDLEPNHGFIPIEYINHPKVVVDTLATPSSMARGCQMPTRFLSVLADGSCVACCVGMDDWSLPKVTDSSLAEVWNSVGMAEVRRKWQTADDSLPCGFCIKRTDC